MSEKKNINETSTEMRDAIASQLLDIVKNGVEATDNEGNKVRRTAPASYFAVAKDFLRMFPPMDLPGAKTPSGELKAYMDENVLPFDKQKKA